MSDPTFAVYFRQDTPAALWVCILETPSNAEAIYKAEELHHQRYPVRIIRSEVVYEDMPARSEGGEGT